MVVSTADRSRDAHTPGSATPKGVLSMLTQSTTFGDTRLPTRFWQYVQVRDDGCWQWLSALRGRLKYGTFWHERKSVTAHRFSFERLCGPVPPGLQLDHLCRNPQCVNPAHLEVVPNRVNVLRGVGPTAHNARKTHCLRGHPFTTGNTYHPPGSAHRYCRECDDGRKQRYREESQ